MAKSEPKLKRPLSEIRVQDSTWLDLGQLRAAVKLADEHNWPDSSLISHGLGSDHPTLRDTRIAKTLIIEGETPSGAR